MSGIFLSDKEHKEYIKGLYLRKLEPVNFKTMLTGHDSASGAASGSFFSPEIFSFTPDFDTWIAAVMANTTTFPTATLPYIQSNTPMCRTRLDISRSNEQISLTAAPTVDNRNLIFSMVGGLDSMPRGNGGGINYFNTIAAGVKTRYANFQPHGFFLQKGKPIYIMFYALPDAGNAIAARHNINVTLYTNLIR